MLIDIVANTIIKLALHLKEVQIDVMSNGNEYVPILPNFELYQMQLSQVHTLPDLDQCDWCEMQVQDAKLLSEFFMRLVAEISNDQHDSTFLPKGAAYLRGPQTYVQVLKDNNFFLSNMATIPINLVYDAWFAIIDPHTTSEIDPISLHKHLLCKPWFL